MTLIAAAMLLLSVQTTPDEQTTLLAQQVGIDPMALQGAINATGASPVAYLAYEGLLDPPEPALAERPARGLSVDAPTPKAPPSSALAARAACIEAKESGGANILNRHGSGAGGVMQYMPGTFAAHAREMGHPEWSLWNPEEARAVAAHDLAMGRRSQWTVSGC